MALWRPHFRGFLAYGCLGAWPRSCSTVRSTCPCSTSRPSPSFRLFSSSATSRPLIRSLHYAHSPGTRCPAYPARPRTSTSGSSSTAVCAIWNSSRNLGHCPRCPFGSLSAAMSSAMPISVSTCDRSCELRVLTQPGWYRCRSKLCRLWESRDPASAFAKRGEQTLLRCRHGV